MNAKVSPSTIEAVIRQQLEAYNNKGIDTFKENYSRIINLNQLTNNNVAANPHSSF